MGKVEVLSETPTWQEITDSVGMLECPVNQAVTRMRCLNTNCSHLQLQCATLLGGRLKRTGIKHTSPWFPPILGQQSDRFCAENHVLTGLNVGIGKRQLVCRLFLPNGNCQRLCSLVGLTCGDDGCGGSCGSCSGTDTCCYGTCQDPDEECTQMAFVSAAHSLSTPMYVV